ncbi:MAG: hypothetical protein E7068_02470 [Lentimicrobiaceae bacterium]|nr:hypothetical protein [Lentimicrobiaceae bacterium]
MSIQLKKENVLNAYKNANYEEKNLLEQLFGKEIFKPTDVRERIKTFEEALNELELRSADGDKYAESLYDDWHNVITENNDLTAFLKLRIITEALNEGWKPQFVEDERRWYPYFRLYTKEEIEKMDDEIKARVVARSSSNAYAYGGVSYANAFNDSAYVIANFGSRLAFKTAELAEYAGKQFIDIYADFCFIPKE